MPSARYQPLHNCGTPSLDCSAWVRNHEGHLRAFAFGTNNAVMRASERRSAAGGAASVTAESARAIGAIAAGHAAVSVIMASIAGFASSTTTFAKPIEPRFRP